MNIVAISQARLSSTRFPEKILKKIQGQSLLEMHLKRILKSKLISKLVLAIPLEEDNDCLVQIADNLGVKTFKGSLLDVLDRYYNAALPENPDYIVRLTSDCPLIDPNVIDQIIICTTNNGFDYCSNTLKPTYPDGIDVEVFKFSALKKAWEESRLKSDREHVTPYIWRNSTYNNIKIFTSFSYENDVNFSSQRMTVDTPEDFLLIEQLVNKVGNDKDWLSYSNFLNDNIELLNLNSSHKRNEGLIKSIRNDNDN